MWVLIMTLWWGTSCTFTTIEFTSEENCRYGGAQQEVALRNDLGMNTKNYTFICVKK